MAVKIRLTRLGKKKQPTYRVVVMDSRKQRDGKYIEQLGIYDPKQDPSLVKIDNERALYWLNTGAQPTERAQKLLEISGAWTQFRIAKGDIHTVGDDAPEPVKESKVEAVVVEAVEDVAEEVVEETTETAAEDATDETTEEAPVSADEAADSSDES
ncbi:MAG: 30S ribosomal protein S16 [Acidimicrobiia bacterium]